MKKDYFHKLVITGDEPLWEPGSDFALAIKNNLLANKLSLNSHEMVTRDGHVGFDDCRLTPLFNISLTYMGSIPDSKKI